MKTTIPDAMMELIRCCLLETEPDAAFSLSDGEWDAVVRLANHHDLAHLLFRPVKTYHLLPADCRVFQVLKECYSKAMLRVMRFQTEQSRIAALLEGAGIPFIFLKGAVLRELYPEAWMRTSADLDLLVHEQDIDRASTLLIQTANYTSDGKMGFHHMHMESPQGMTLELHYRIEEGRKNVDPLLSRVWEFAVPMEGKRAEYRLQEEFFSFYHLAHMSHHLLMGGCGVRPFLDFWLLRKTAAWENETLQGFLEQTGMTAFAASVCRLGDHWMEQLPVQPVDEHLEEFVLDGGTYGTNRSSAAVHNGKKGRLRYLLLRILPSYGAMVSMYPWLRNRRILLPLAWAIKWLRLLRKEARQHARQDARQILTVPQSRIHAAGTLMQELQLDEM